MTRQELLCKLEEDPYNTLSCISRYADYELFKIGIALDPRCKELLGSNLTIDIHKKEYLLLL